MIEVKGLSKKYGSNLAVDDASFTIDDGEVVGFLGPNGAGKSTTMNIITGFLSPTQGSVTVDGYDILEDPIKAKARIGYLPEQPPLYIDMTVAEYLNFVYDLKKAVLPRKAHLAQIYELVKIDNVKDRLIRNLSKGYRQRVGIAQALVGNPGVLILDEPTVGLDPQQIIEIRTLIAKLGRNHTVILSSHILSEIQAVCKRCIIINHGQIIADGSVEELSDKLSDDNSIALEVLGPPKEVKKSLENIGSVNEVRVTGFNNTRTTQYAIQIRRGYADRDVRVAIFDAMSNHHWPIVALSSNRLSLENIFLKLVDMTPEEAKRSFNKEENNDENNDDKAEIIDSEENITVDIDNESNINDENGEEN